MRPDNIVLNISAPEKLKIIDFGSSCLGTDSGEFGQCHLWYRSPEQLMFNEADYRADYFALGCILYEMHTGKPLFCANGEFQLCKQLIQIQGGSEVARAVKQYQHYE